MSVEIGRQNIIILEITTAQFHFWEYINGNQTFIVDSHRPFICSAFHAKYLTHFQSFFFLHGR
jgi:hypothetical protein